MHETEKWIIGSGTMDSIPEWQRTFHVAEDGELFAAAWIGGDEQDAFMRAAYDGVPMVRDCGHVYLPVMWLRHAYNEDGQAMQLLDTLEESAAKVLPN